MSTNVRSGFFLSKKTQWNQYYVLGVWYSFFFCHYRTQIWSLMKHILAREYLSANFVYMGFEDIRRVLLNSRLIRILWFMWIWEFSREIIPWLFSAEICSWVCIDFNIFYLYFDWLDHFTFFMHFAYLMIELG